MKKIISRLALGLFLAGSFLSLIPTQAVVAQTPDQVEADINRRDLFHLIRCLQRDTTFDEDDDGGNNLTSADDIFVNRDEGFHVQLSEEVVGLDISGSGTLTCLEAMYRGLEVLRPGDVRSASINNMGNYFIRQAFGEDFAIAGSSPTIDMDTDQFNATINGIIAEATAAMATYEAQIAGAESQLLRLRVLDLVRICFDVGGYNSGRVDTNLYLEIPDVGYLYDGRTRSEVIGTRGNLLPFLNAGGESAWWRIGNPFGGDNPAQRDRDIFAGDVNTGYSIQAENTDVVWPLDQRFYPVGLDVPQTQGAQNGLVDCNFVEQNAGLIFDGIRIGEDGEYENRDGTPLTGALADASAPIGLGAGLEAGDNCESAADFAFAFVLCPILALSDNAITWLDNEIISALNVSGQYYNNPDIKSAWGNIRNISLILLIPVVLMMVIGTALQFSFVDAYTVKRALPRIFVAIIFITLSFDIASIMIDLTNAVGKGIVGIITAPFGGIQSMTLQNIFAPTGENNFLFTGAVLGGIGIAFLSGVTIWTLFSFLGMAALALLIIFLLLSVRELMIIFLVVISPIAIITWIFPGNDKGWKLWWGTFSKMLLLYPIIMAFLGVGRAFASMVNDASINEETNGVVNTLVKLVAFVGPYFFIPKAFQMAGGAFANLAGMVNDRSKGIFDRQKKFRADQRKDARERNLSGNRFRNAPKGSIRARLNKTTQSASMLQEAGYRPSRVTAAKRLRAMEEMDHASKDPGVGAVLANDDASQALLHGRGTLQGKIDYLMDEVGYSEADATQIANELQLLERKHGGETLKAMAVVQLAGSKTAFRGGPAEMAKSILEAAEGDTQVAATLYAKARSAAEQAGRVDLAGYSYGEGLVAFQQIWNADDKVTDANGMTERDGAANAVNSYLLNKVVDSKGAGALITSHGTSVKNVTAIMNDRLQRATSDFESARARGDYSAMDEAHERQMATLAEIANAYDAAAYASPENAREFRDNVLKQKINFVDYAQETVMTTEKRPVQKQVTRSVPNGSGGFESVTETVTEMVDVQVPKVVPRKNENGQLIETTRSITVQKLMEDSRSDETFRQTRREHSLTEEEMRRRGTNTGGGFGMPGA